MGDDDARDGEQGPLPGPFKLLQIDRCNFWVREIVERKPGGAEFFLPCLLRPW